MHNPQLNKNGELQHLITLEGLPPAVITRILDTAASRGPPARDEPSSGKQTHGKPAWPEIGRAHV
jgi:hypothetical protein